MLPARFTLAVLLSLIFPLSIALAADPIAAGDAPGRNSLRSAASHWTVIGGDRSASAAPQSPADVSSIAPQQAPADSTPVLFRVLEVQGEVQAAPVGTRDWQTLTVGDAVPPNMVVRTGIRSQVKFQIGEGAPYAAMVVDTVGRIVLSEAYRTADLQRIRVGVGYGRIRAGVAEEGIETDFVVDSPVASLSKRGTWDFGLSYTRGTDEFEIFLLDHGLVEALNKVTNKRRRVLPGQVVRQTMRNWLDEVRIDRNVAVADILGQPDVEVAFNKFLTDGLGVLNPGQGRSEIVVNLTTTAGRAEFAQLAASSLARSLATAAVAAAVPPDQRVFSRPEGFFGTGSADDLIPVVIDRSNPLAERRVAQPGRYLIRRAALEAFTRDQQQRRRR